MGKTYKLDEQISVNMLSLTFVLVKSKYQNYLAQKMAIWTFVLLIYMVLLLSFSMLSIFTESVTHFMMIFES